MPLRGYVPLVVWRSRLNDSDIDLCARSVPAHEAGNRYRVHNLKPIISQDTVIDQGIRNSLKLVRQIPVLAVREVEHALDLAANYGHPDALSFDLMVHLLKHTAMLCHPALKLSGWYHLHLAGTFIRDDLLLVLF